TFSIQGWIQIGEVSVFDLVAKPNDELKVFALRWVLVAKKLLHTFGQVPMLGITIYFDVSDTRPFTSFAVPWPFTIPVENGVKNCCPGDHDEHEVLCGAKSRPRSIVCIHCCQRGRAGLFKVVPYDPRQTFGHLRS